jgi:hypothetical protein
VPERSYSRIIEKTYMPFLESISCSEVRSAGSCTSILSRLLVIFYVLVRLSKNDLVLMPTSEATSHAGTNIYALRHY